MNLEVILLGAYTFTLLYPPGELILFIFIKPLGFKFILPDMNIAKSVLFVVVIFLYNYMVQHFP